MKNKKMSLRGAARRSNLAMIAASCFALLAMTPSVKAEEFQYGKNTLRLTAKGSAGVINEDNFSDFLLRAQASRLMPNKWNVGAIYSIDRDALDRKYKAKDAFLYAETEWGRLESGWTESIASKLALTLPDVGGTRLDRAPFFHRGDFVGITDSAASGNRYAWRMNMATLPTRPFQFGFGRTIGTPDGFNESTDFGIRYRNTGGRTKTSASFGFSYMSRLRDMIDDAYLPPASARARYQGAFGLNVQTGSIMLAAVAKAVLDERPAAARSDGLQLGGGASYDFLAWSASANYIFSNVGIFSGAENLPSHTGVLSARYKITRHFNIWASGGAVIAEKRDPTMNYFLSGGLGIAF